MSDRPVISWDSNSTTRTTTSAPAEGGGTHTIDRQFTGIEAPPEAVGPLHIQPANDQRQHAPAQASALFFSTSTSGTSGNGNTAMRILAKSLVRELGKQGYGSREAIVLSTELVRLISAEMEHHRKMRYVSLSNGAGPEAPSQAGSPALQTSAT
ncbi:hypothetical protein WMF26_12475 [Sorangium sp. So ce185]|uniref:hypothetical protein n=1 Tax=Sorangium sp. So ce185 TaxID=3133287 RepID=UPI003F5E3404